ncbi:MAG: protein TolQ [Alphaproteobacteria bacterium]|nr:protein TolQ [Alphaproteobacteria bacterium]
MEIAHELSLWSLLLNTDWLGKLVIGLLLVFSVFSWSIIFYKIKLLYSVQHSSEKFIEKFRQSNSLFQLAADIDPQTKEPTERMFLAAIREWRLSTAGKTLRRNSLDERITKVLQITLDEENQTLQKSLPFLATVSSTAPFIGLFGTVWGIMTAFQAIANTKQTSLAVVAPGISEALFATALGLVAAIPAAYFYNHLNARLGNYIGMLERFGEQFMVILSRHFDKTLQSE